MSVFGGTKRQTMKKYLTEGIGTFLFSLVLLLCTNNGAAALAPLVAGAALVALLWAGEWGSEAHYNPALSVAALIRGRLDRTECFYRCIAQGLGGFLAALPAAFLLHNSDAAFALEARQNDWLATLLAELTGTFALAYTALRLLREQRKAAYAAAQGLVFAAFAYAFEGVHWGAFNPALALGHCTLGMVAWADYWVYAAGGLLGAAAAATLVGNLEGEEG
jgi:aquaporin Z